MKNELTDAEISADATLSEVATKLPWLKEDVAYRTTNGFGIKGDDLEYIVAACNHLPAYIAALRQARPIPVVAAVLRTQDGQYVIGQRKPNQWMANKWCFVGGKVEAGESL